MLNLVNPSLSVRPEEIRLSLDEIAREGAREMLVRALRAEVTDYVNLYQELRDEEGHRLVVRHGKAQTRRVTLASGTIEVQAPRVRDRREGERFCSSILPAYMRKSPKVENLLPILYLKGLSTSDFRSALTDFLGEGVTGLSPASIVLLKKTWEKDFAIWKKKKITDRYVYLFADGVHVSVRLGEDKKLCLLVLIGVAENGEKHLLAVEPGYRESKDSWAAVLADLRDRGLVAPVLAVGDGALGFWGALRETRGFEAMAFKLLEDAEKTWNRIRGYDEIKNVLNGVAYVNGVVVPAVPTTCQEAPAA